jgi:hypothetical protein
MEATCTAGTCKSGKVFGLASVVLIVLLFGLLIFLRGRHDDPSLQMS